MAKKQPDYVKLATDAYNDARGKPALIEDDVSLCDYIKRQYGVDLTLKQAEKVREQINKIEEAEAEEENKADVVVVLDCRTADPFNPQHVKSYKNTKRGKELAEAVFREWVESVRDDGSGEDDKDDNFDMDAAVTDGLYETGEGFIAMIETNC